MKWQQSVQKEFLKIMRQPTSGTKVVLVQRILNCIPIEEAIKVVQEYKVWKNTKKHKELNKPMEIEILLTEEEERKVKVLGGKKIREKKRAFQEEGLEVMINDDNTSTQHTFLRLHMVVS